jgi:hypothetical protein
MKKTLNYGRVDICFLCYFFGRNKKTTPCLMLKRDWLRQQGTILWVLLKTEYFSDAISSSNFFCRRVSFFEAISHFFMFFPCFVHYRTHDSHQQGIN